VRPDYDAVYPTALCWKTRLKYIKKREREREREREGRGEKKRKQRERDNLSKNRVYRLNNNLSSVLRKINRILRERILKLQFSEDTV